nr:PREDICTED: uncharacterized protein LOC105664030 [Megachile rotundata]
MAKSSDDSTSQSASQSIHATALRRKRGNIVGHITTFEKIMDKMQKSDKRDIGLLRTHLDSMHLIWERFNAVQFELEELDDSESPRRYEYHGRYIAAVTQANQLIEGSRSSAIPRRNTTDSSSPSVAAPMAIKLPEMRLPTFDGNIENWTSYFDSFYSMIDQNADLTPVQKLQYLRSTLTGKAAACIQSLSTTDANYADAIDLLKEKFGYTVNNDLLVTAQVGILDNTQRPVNARALIDTGATTNFITENLIERLKIPKKECSIPVGALNAMTTIAKNQVKATIKSKVNAYQRTLTFLTIPKIAQHIPDQPFDRSKLKIPQNIRLADPDFHRPAPIDLLFGSGVALSMLSVGQISLSSLDEPDLYLQKTRLGWVIGGSPPSPTQGHGALCHATNTLQSDISRFWEIEEGSQCQILSDADKYCEAHFQQHVSRRADGRYVVALPFNDKIRRLGESKSQAQRRLTSLEKKLRNNAALKDNYHAVMNEYLELGHMVKVSEDTDARGYYLPHHGVTKITSETTKLRVVFDGSAATNTGVSLNDALYVGPKLQDDLLYILLRFRLHQYVITGDIEKMYRQFIVRPKDRKYQRILWRDTDGEIQTYELQRVTFGLSAAPYLSIRCLFQLAKDEGHRFPEAAKILTRDFYVDDALTGASSIKEARAIREQLTKLLSLAGLNIRQWAANHKAILRDLPEQDKKRSFGTMQR